MRRTIFLKTLMLFGSVALILSGCANGFLGIGMSENESAAFAAGALFDYVAEQGYEEVDELDAVDDTYDTDSSRALSESDVTIEFQGFTLIIKHTRDDNDTPSDPTDDQVTVERLFDFNEADRYDILVRPRRPTTDSAWDTLWAADPEDQIVQSTPEDQPIEHKVGEIAGIDDTAGIEAAVTVSTGNATVTWMREIDTVWAYQIVQENTRVTDPNLIHRRTVLRETADSDRSLTFEKEVDGEIIHSFVVEQWTDPEDGLEYTRIVRDDGGYAVIREKKNPRIVDYYSAEDVRFMRSSETNNRSARMREVTRTWYDEEGNEIGSTTVEFALTYEDGVATISRSTGGRTRQVQITEEGEVYVVSWRGNEYRIVFEDPYTMIFVDDDGDEIARAERTEDGRWRIVRDGDSEIVEG